MTFSEWCAGEGGDLNQYGGNGGYYCRYPDGHEVTESEWKWKRISKYVTIGLILIGIAMLTYYLVTGKSVFAK